MVALFVGSSIISYLTALVLLDLGNESKFSDISRACYFFFFMLTMPFMAAFHEQQRTRPSRMIFGLRNVLFFSEVFFGLLCGLLLVNVAHPFLYLSENVDAKALANLFQMCNVFFLFVFISVELSWTFSGGRENFLSWIECMA